MTGESLLLRVSMPFKGLIPSKSFSYRGIQLFTLASD